MVVYSNMHYSESYANVGETGEWAAGKHRIPRGQRYGKYAEFFHLWDWSVCEMGGSKKVVLIDAMSSFKPWDTPHTFDSHRVGGGSILGNCTYSVYKRFANEGHGNYGAGCRGIMECINIAKLIGGVMVYCEQDVLVHGDGREWASVLAERALESHKLVTFTSHPKGIETGLWAAPVELLLDCQVVENYHFALMSRGEMFAPLDKCFFEEWMHRTIGDENIDYADDLICGGRGGSINAPFTRPITMMTHFDRAKLEGFLKQCGKEDLMQHFPKRSK